MTLLILKIVHVFVKSFSMRSLPQCFCHMTRHLIDKLLTNTYIILKYRQKETITNQIRRWSSIHHHSPPLLLIVYNFLSLALAKKFLEIFILFFKRLRELMHYFPFNFKSLVINGVLWSFLQFLLYLPMAKVMVHKSFPYAPYINTSQPLDFFHFVFVLSLSTLLKNKFSLTLSKKPIWDEASSSTHLRRGGRPP